MADPRELTSQLALRKAENLANTSESSKALGTDSTRDF